MNLKYICTRLNVENSADCKLFYQNVLQRSAVAHHLLKRGNFQVRALVRDTEELNSELSKQSLEELAMKINPGRSLRKHLNGQ